MKLFTAPRHRKYLEEELRKIGFECKISTDVQTPFTVHFRPLDSRRVPMTLIVNWLEEIGYVGKLNRVSDGIEEVATFVFDESERFSKSCYLVWADWIVDAVSAGT